MHPNVPPPWAGGGPVEELEAELVHPWVRGFVERRQRRGGRSYGPVSTVNRLVPVALAPCHTGPGYMQEKQATR